MDVNAASTRTLLDLAHAQLTLSDIPAARKLVDRALAQADYDVEITRSAAWEAREGFSYQLIAAYAYMKSGDSAAAMALLQLVSALLDRMSAAGIERHGIHEIRAQVAALRGDPEGAMQQLTRASQLGWNNTWAADHEPLLDALHARDDYRALTKRIKAANQRLPNPRPANAGGSG